MAQTTSSNKQAQNNLPKYLDWIQCNPGTFNASQKVKKDAYKNEHGEKELNKILWGNKHHELKAHRSVDYSLNEEELQILKDSGVLLKELPEPQSFPQLFLNLYTNDMPIVVTSDCMLFALHKFYDTWLKNLEQGKLITKFKTVCTNILDELYTIIPTEQNKSYLMQLEVFFMVPLVLMNLNKELGDTFVDNTTLLYPIEEVKLMLKEECTKTKYTKTKYQVDGKKVRSFSKFIGIPHSQYDVWETEALIRHHEKLSRVLNHFEVPDVDEPVIFKFGGRVLFESIIKQIKQNLDIELELGSVTIKMMGTLFKPRGHYTESLILKKYFMAFTWFSQFDLLINDKEESVGAVLLASLIAKIAEKHLDSVNELQTFISTIIGKADGYTLSTFLELINRYIPKELELSLNETIEWLGNSGCYQLWQDIIHDPTIKSPTLGKFGDKEGDSIERVLSFSLFGKATQIDNTIISKLIDDKLMNSHNQQPLRKFPLIYDLVYTLFNNKAVKDDITNLMDNVKVQQRDGYKYSDHLETLSSECDNHVFDDTLYSQELKMLRSLVTDKINVFPFNTTAWGKKQAVTQVAHYAELRHDNCLYIQEVCGMGLECEYPDLLVEPVPTFWKEMLTFVNMMKNLVEPQTKDHRILEKFTEVLNMLIQYVDLYLSGKPIDEHLMEKLKSIIVVHHGSGSPDYGGWYMELFHNAVQAMKFKPEVSSFCTGVNDERGPGGIVHLGTGPCKLMYLLTTDHVTNEPKIMVGPTYSAYEVITDYNTRLNDEEWKTEYVKHVSL